MTTQQSGAAAPAKTGARGSRAVSLALLAAAAPLLHACAGKTTSTDITITIAPGSATLRASGSVGFSCVVTGASDHACLWSVEEGAAGGAISAEGFYTAPARAGTYHVVGEARADRRARAVAEIVVNDSAGIGPEVSVAVSPASASVSANASQPFACTVTGAADASCSWSVQESAGGSVTAAGVYTAPATAGTYHVVATSRADPMRFAVATVSVTVPPTPSVTVSVSPGAASVYTGGSHTFGCTVSGAADTSCTWSVREGSAGGTITSGGVYTAPATTGTYHVVAASNADPSKQASAAVTVTAPPAAVTVSVDPTSASLSTGGSQTFRCVVTGAADTSCAWSIQESGGGTVTTAGAYTAPATAGTYHVVATSHADATKQAVAIVAVTSASGGFVTPSPVTGDVVVSMDASSGTRAISPFIFGTNYVGELAPTQRTVATMWRAGGNRITGYDWETGYSNAGSDYGPYHNDTHLLGDGNPAAAYRTTTGVFDRAGTWANAALLTVPTIGYVAGSWTGNASVPAAPDVTTVTPPAVGSGTTSGVWRRSLPGRTGDTSHASATATPDLSDDTVYQDDFLTWLKASYGAHLQSSSAPIFVALDNEPDLWGSTHPEIRGKPSGDKVYVQLGYDELVTNNATYAAMVKSVLGDSTQVFGFVSYGWMGYVSLGNVDASAKATAPPAGYDWYLGYYLDKMRAASAQAGKRLLDVLDLHWYPEASSATGRIVGKDDAAQDAETIVAREQAPRSLWDPNYLENSWIQHWDIHIPGCTWGQDASRCSLKLLPNVRNMIDTYYPGTKLAFSEWGYGREMDVSGAIAGADVLGIFAREGVYAASNWPGGGSDVCLAAAFRAFLDYDGSRGHFGDTFIPTTVSDGARPVDPYLSGKSRGDGTTIPTQYLERVTAYASFDAAAPGRAVVVAINKDLASTLDAGFAIKQAATFHTVEVYRVTGANGGSGGCTGPVRQADITLTATNAFHASLPPQSITVLVLKP